MRCIPSQFLYELGPDFEEKLDDCTGDRESFDPDDGEAPTMLRPGQAVRHRSFGVGTVTQFIDMGADSIAVVRFKSGQTKALMLKYAGLSAL